MRITRCAAALAVFAGASQAQTIDGAVGTGEYPVALALQSTQTGFGNNFSELDGAYGNYTVGGAMNLAFTGNLEGNSNGFVLFLDSRNGGVRSIARTNATDPQMEMARVPVEELARLFAIRRRHHGIASITKCTRDA